MIKRLLITFFCIVGIIFIPYYTGLGIDYFLRFNISTFFLWNLGILGIIFLYFIIAIILWIKNGKSHEIHF